MKIVVLDAASLGGDVDLSPILNLGETTVYEHVTPEEAPEIIADAEVIVYNKTKLTAQLLEHAKKLKVVCVTATGFDTVDTGYCRDHGIAVCNVPGYSTDSVAQLSVALALNLATHLREYREFVHSGAYSAGNIANKLSPCWNELTGKTWGIVGMGNIGREVARLAEAFGCEVSYYSTSGVERKEEYPTLPLVELLRSSDVVSIHCPLNDRTRSLIGAEQLALMKPSAILINVARGGIVDEAALADALNEERLRGAALDVFTSEPLRESPLYTLRDPYRLLASPHNAWSPVEAIDRLIGCIEQNIADYVARR
ncbi:MAG: hydroxyacid dehydrogenase [Alistipes sp.]|nr:hydroxyacid dehydrogenase [Alistipes sp.]